MDEGERVSGLTIDELDLRLVRELERDARQSSSKLAAKTGATPMTVYRRVRRLCNAGVITFAAIPALPAMGFRVRAYIGLKIRPGKSDEVGEKLRRCPGILVIVSTTGRYDMLLDIFFRDHREMLNFIDEELGNISDLVSSETMMVLETEKASWRFLNGKRSRVREAVSRRFDESELRLIAELMRDPRATIISLAKKLDMDRMTVSRKLQTLLDEKIIEVVGVASPPALGYGSQAAIFVRVENGKIRSVADALARNKRIPSLHIVTGHFDILFWILFQDSQEMSYFMRTGLSDIPGIISYEAMPATKVLELPFPIVTPLIVQEDSGEHLNQVAESFVGSTPAA